MTKPLRVLAIVVVAGGAALVVAAYSANRLVQRFKPEIEAAASNALHASVSLGSVSASLFPSLRIHVEEARIATQPGSADALSLKGLVLHVQLLPLLARRVVIETVSLDEPAFTMVKARDGMFIEGLPRPPAPPADPAARGPAPPAGATQRAPVSSRLSIDLRQFEISDATFTWRDAETNNQLSVTNIDLTAALAMKDDTAAVSRLALQADFPHAQHVSVSGKGQTFDLRTGELTLGDLQASVPGGIVALSGAASVYAASGKVAAASEAIKLDDVLTAAATFAPSLSGVTLRGTVKPQVEAAFAPAAYSASGRMGLQNVAFQRDTLSVSALSGEVVLAADAAKQTMTAEDLSFVLNGKPGTITFSAVVEGDTVRLAPLAISALSGSLSGSAQCSLASPNSCTARLEGAGFSIAALQALGDPRAPVQMEGVVSKLTSDLRGHAGNDVARSLSGTAAIGVQHAVLKGFNLAEVVLTGARRVPLLASAIDVPRFKRYLSSRNTEIESLTGDFSIRSGWAETKNLRLESEPFTLVGSGRFSFQSDVHLVAIVTFNRELSQVMIGRAKELRPILNDDQTLSVPVTVDGRLPNVDARPDVTKLIEASTKNVLEGKVGKTLQKALSGEEKAGGKLLDQLLGK